MNSSEFTALLAHKFYEFFSDIQQLCGNYLQKKPIPIKKSINKRSSGKSQEVDPDMPKKPSTAYILYFKDNKDKFIKQYPNTVITEITKLIAKEWSELPKDDQLPYLQRAEKTKLNYIEKMKEYAKKHPGTKIPCLNNRKKPPTNHVNSVHEINSSIMNSSAKKGKKNALIQSDDDDEEEIQSNNSHSENEQNSRSFEEDIDIKKKK